jgi:arylsulfatase A-like enzyme
VGLNEYPNPERDHDGHWGIRDRPFLQFWAQELAREQEPFLSCLFTLSSHHPYELPPAEQERFGGGSQKIHATLRYTDDAVRQFFATARTMPWFHRTIFVITSDHTADIERNGQQVDSAIDYWIPLFYHAPGILPPQQRSTITQQIDILPTLMDLVSGSAPFFSFGRSAVRTRTAPVAVVHGNALYHAFGPRLHLQFDGERTISSRPLAPHGDADALEAAEMELHLKAAIQQYNHHMLEGTLVLPHPLP